LFLSWNAQPSPAPGGVEIAPAARVGFFPDSLGTLPAREGLVRTKVPS
jgi:hypothetical protein